MKDFDRYISFGWYNRPEMCKDCGIEFGSDQHFFVLRLTCFYECNATPTLSSINIKDMSHYY